jgi:trans-2,3-dihydro-3-hydroxyanthranilate isomerase
VPFAGHPVLGAATVVGAALGRSAVVLETGAGPVGVELRPSSARAFSASMAQPIPTWERLEATEPLLAALGVESASLPVERYTNGPVHILVSLDAAERVASLDPDLRALQASAGDTCVSCFAAVGSSVKTRMFAPGLGVPEDPATGSAAGPLAVHLVRHGRAAYGQQLEISQGAELLRPSLLLARIEGEGARIDRVEVGGQALLIGRGEIWPG